MNNQEKIIVGDEVDRLAAVWSLRTLLHPQAFKRLSKIFVTGEEEVFQVVGLEHINLAIICAAELHKIMKDHLKTLEEHHSQRNEPLFLNIDVIGRMVGLSEHEKEILLFATILQNSPGLEEALEYLGACSIPGLINNLSYILKIRTKHIAAALRSDGPLCSSGLIDLQRKRRSLDIGDRLEALEGLAHVLQDPHAEVESALSAFFCKVPSPNLTMADFEHLNDDLTIVSALLAASVQEGIGGVNILIYGPPGTGKPNWSECWPVI